MPPDRMSTTPRTPLTAATNNAVASDGCHRSMGRARSVVAGVSASWTVAPTDSSRASTYLEGSSPSTPGPATQTADGTSRQATAARSRASPSGLRRPGSPPTARMSPPTSTSTTPSDEVAAMWAASCRCRSTTPPVASSRTRVAASGPVSEPARAGSVEPAGGIGCVRRLTTLGRPFIVPNPVKSRTDRGPGNGSTMRRSQESVAITGDPACP